MTSAVKESKPAKSKYCEHEISEYESEQFLHRAERIAKLFCDDLESFRLNSTLSCFVYELNKEEKRKQVAIFEFLQINVEKKFHLFEYMLL